MKPATNPSRFNLHGHAGLRRPGRLTNTLSAAQAPDPGTALATSRGRALVKARLLDQPCGRGGQRAEPELDRLSNILSAVSEQFGNVE